MKQEDVPQDSNSTYGGHRKLLYAVDTEGQYTGVQSAGWAVEAEATRDAIAEINRQRLDAWQRAKQGLTSPLEFHMFDRRMDLALLAQTTGLFQWRVRRHLRPQRFRKLSRALVARYCEALNMSEQELRQLPGTPPSD